MSQENKQQHVDLASQAANQNTLQKNFSSDASEMHGTLQNTLSSKGRGVSKHQASTLEPEVYQTIQNKALHKLNKLRDLRKRQQTYDRAPITKFNKKRKKDIWELQADKIEAQDKLNKPKQSLSKYNKSSTYNGMHNNLNQGIDESSYEIISHKQLNREKSIQVKRLSGMDSMRGTGYNRPSMQ